MAKKRACQVLGMIPAAPAGLVSTTNLNAANTWFGYSFILPENKTLSKVKVYVSAIAGTQANIACTASIYSDGATGIPNASVETVTIAAGAFPLGAAGVLEFTGFTTALTANTRYWIVIKNTSAVPGTDYFTIRFGGAQTGPFGTSAGGLSTWGWSKNHTTDGGSTWSNGIAATFGMRLEFASSGGYDGFLGTNLANSATADSVYALRERGVKIVTPPDAILRVLGVMLPITKGGTPTNALRLRLYNDTTLLATTGDIPVGCVSGTHYWMASYFTTVQVINPNTTLRIVAGTTGADSSSNRYILPEYAIENDANSKALLPFSAQSTYLNGTWSDDPLLCSPFGLILDSEDEFGTVSGGGNTFSRALVVNGAA